MNEFCKNCDERDTEICVLPSRLEAFIANLASARSKSVFPFLFSHQINLGANTGDQGGAYLEKQRTNVTACIADHQATLVL